MNLSQNDALAIYLVANKRKGISQLEAREVLGIQRLASRIADLRVKGMSIRVDMRRDIRGKRYARYYFQQQ